MKYFSFKYLSIEKVLKWKVNTQWEKLLCNILKYCPSGLGFWDCPQGTRQTLEQRNYIQGGIKVRAPLLFTVNVIASN